MSTTAEDILATFDFSLLESPDFKEDSVREEIILPILKELGYRAAGSRRIIRSKALSHPFVQIESLAEYLLVAQEPYRIERYVRQTAAQWLYSEVHRAEDVLTLETVDCRLALKDVYAKVA